MTTPALINQNIYAVMIAINKDEPERDINIQV